MDDFARSLIAPVLLAAIAAVPGVLAYYSTRSKLRAEHEASAAEAWREMLAPMRERLLQVETELAVQREVVAQQQVRIAALEMENSQLISGVRLLAQQLRSNGQAPLWEYRES